MGETGPSYGKYAAIAGATIGVIAAGAAAGILAERKVTARRRAEESEELGHAARRRADRGRRRRPGAVRRGGRAGAEAATSGPSTPRRRSSSSTATRSTSTAGTSSGWPSAATHRMVLFDQRSHGRSGRSRADHANIDFCGDDLAHVLDQLVPEGPVVLVGHSMGGMTIMALAAQHPEWFGDPDHRRRADRHQRGWLRRRDLRPSRAARAAAAPDGARRWSRRLGRAPRLVESSRRVGVQLRLRADPPARLRRRRAAAVRRLHRQDAGGDAVRRDRRVLSRASARSTRPRRSMRWPTYRPRSSAAPSTRSRRSRTPSGSPSCCPQPRWSR